MPTAKQLTDQTRRLLANRKHDVVSKVLSAAMHIIYNSQLAQTELWPKKDFVSGFGIECTINDRVYVGINAYGLDKEPVEGTLVFNIHTKHPGRHKKQSNQIRLIMDQAFYDGIYFTDYCDTPRFVDNPWFSFKILQ